MQRDMTNTKKELFNRMIGHVPEINDPGNCGGRINAYPNAYYTQNPAGSNPSIHSRMLYIPLNCWFMIASQMAFPIIALKYNELRIRITLRPLNELFRIRDVTDHINNFPYISPNFNMESMQMYKFLHPPPSISLDDYQDTRIDWKSDIHLNCTYCFLSADEGRRFTLNEQKYLFKQVRERTIHDIAGANKVLTDSVGLTTSYLFYFQRSDANLRNEWSNYTNWAYNYMPNDIIPALLDFSKTYETNPGINPDGSLTRFMITDTYTPDNDKDILISMGLLLNGEYRENVQPVGVFDYIEKYHRTSGNATNGLYCYNYALNNSLSILQPSGGINMSQFSKIEFEFNTIKPALDPNAQSLVICDPETGEVIGINKQTWKIYDYSFDLHLFEEHINIITFVGGNCGLMFAT